jgi:molybdate transport system substrate-binding protein
VKRFRWLAACAAIVWLSACGGSPENSSGRPRIRVAAASDLNAALPDLMVRFSATHAADVVVSYGSSGTFYMQLLNGAPFDLFLSADVAYPHQLAERGLTLPGSDFTYATGRIVVWAPASSPLDVEHLGVRAVTDPTVRRVAIANPEHAPYGRAAVAALRKAGVYDAVQSRLVLGENVAQALQFVQSGAAEVGIVALSLARAPNVRSTGKWFEIPADDYPRIDQGGVIMKAPSSVDAAQAFRAFLTSADGREVLKKYGFRVAGE